ncbi:hypothetical protein ANAEL_01490 [Anaerolineales bacterium]|nr:hypothetical protein ANAEL_01490 [Anaerolineales bacterium]
MRQSSLMSGDYNNKPACPSNDGSRWTHFYSPESDRDDQLSVIPVKRLLFGGLAVMITKNNL